MTLTEDELGEVQNLAKRTASSTVGNPVTGADLGAGPGAGKTTTNSSGQRKQAVTSSNRQLMVGRQRTRRGGMWTPIVLPRRDEAVIAATRGVVTKRIQADTAVRKSASGGGRARRLWPILRGRMTGSRHPEGLPSPLLRARRRARRSRSTSNSEHRRGERRARASTPDVSDSRKFAAVQSEGTTT